MSEAVTIKAMTVKVTESTVSITNADKQAAHARVVYLSGQNNQKDLRENAEARINRATALAIVNALANTTTGIANGKADAGKMLKAGTLAYAVVHADTLTNGGTLEAANMRLKDDAKHAGIEEGTVRRMAHADGDHLQVVYRSHK